jgi:hypothetical protein
MSLVSPQYHVLVEAAKDAKVNSGSVSVNHAILSELLSVWHDAQPKEPTAAAPEADQIAVGNAPAPPIDAPPVVPEAPAAVVESKPPAAPASDDAPPVKTEPTIQ